MYMYLFLGAGHEVLAPWTVEINVSNLLMLSAIIFTNIIEATTFI